MNAPFDSRMMRVILQPLTVCLRIFALYVVIHGHYSPGGGFQGGVLLGCSFLLPLLVQGAGVEGTLSKRQADAMAVWGMLLFVALGAAALLFGQPMLDYGVLPFADAALRRYFGILGIEVGVTLAVAGVVVSLYYSLMDEE